MDEKTKAEFEAKSQALRADLKKWEADWAQEHDGSKPGRDDIKRDGDIAQKYKKYNRLRDIIAGKIPPPSKEEFQSRKRKDAPDLVETPHKRSRPLETPSKDRTAPEEFMNSPAISRKLFSPAPATSLGPTPQRDGRVLGLFDLLVEKELGTPRKEIGSPHGERANVAVTPSKKTRVLDDESAARLGRTPMSSSKRQMLNTFMTPLKSRDESPRGKTQGSVSKLQFDTPTFLKRHSLPSVDENVFTAPRALRLPRKPMVRGLSEIVASLRRVEEDALDDDLDALREAENEGMGMPKPLPRPQQPRPQSADGVVIADSQTKQLPLGAFDDEGMYDSPVETEQLGRDGNPLRVFKKKGQKRTTRRVNMRPIKTRRPTTADHPSSDEDDGDDIPETQAATDKDKRDAGSDSEFDDDASQVRKSRERKKPRKESQSNRSKAGVVAKPQKEGTVKKAARKVNELAHANFQKLKLHNHGAKGGPGYNSRFRRKR